MTEVLKTKTVKVDNLTPYPGNPQRHSDEQIALLTASIQEFGWTRTAIVDEDMVILAGHGAIEAAKLAGLDKITVSVAHGFSEEKKAALVVADNQLAKKSHTDDDDLGALVQQIAESGFDVDILGFADAELKRLMERINKGDPDAEDDDDSFKPVIQYNIVFDDEAQQDVWFAYLRWLKTEYADEDTLAARLVRHLRELGTDGEI